MYITTKNVELLKEALEKAKSKNKKEFKFQGEVFNVKYAEYLVDWLTNMVTIKS
jgi:hypothetical protein